MTAVTRICLSAKVPSDQPAQRQQLQHRDGEQVGIERCLAGLVPKHRAPGVCPEGAAEERKHQQSRVPNPPPPRPGLRLVHPRRGEDDDVDGEEGGGEVGGALKLF